MNTWSHAQSSKDRAAVHYSLRCCSIGKANRLRRILINVQCHHAHCFRDFSIGQATLHLFDSAFENVVAVANEVWTLLCAIKLPKLACAIRHYKRDKVMLDFALVVIDRGCLSFRGARSVRFLELVVALQSR